MAYRTIHQLGTPNRKEGLALTGTIYPGHLVEMTNATTDTFKLRATAGAIQARAVAVEDDLQGKTVSDAYTISNRIQVNYYKPGEECVVRAANGENIAKGDLLMAGASGTVAKLVADSSGTVVENFPIGIAKEAKDMSDSSAADPSALFRMEWL